MPGEDNDDLRRVLIALGQLTGPIDVEHMGPTKQRGLSRSVRRDDGSHIASSVPPRGVSMQFEVKPRPSCVLCR